MIAIYFKRTVDENIKIMVEILTVFDLYFRLLTVKSAKAISYRSIALCIVELYIAILFL